MFCTNCGKENTSEAKFCQHCGHEVVILDSAKVPKSNKITFTSADVLRDSHDLLESFENQVWVTSLISKKWPKADKDGFNRKVVGRFKGKFYKPIGPEKEIIFTDQYVAVVGKGSLLHNEFAGAFIFRRESVKLIQVGTASHIQNSGTISNYSNWWTINIITNDDKEHPIFLSAGDTPYRKQQLTEIYNAKILILELFWPISLDGGHMDSSSGISMSLGVGFWREVE